MIEVQRLFDDDIVEIDSVWAYASFRGAKVARSTTKRLEASEGAEEPADENASQTASDGAGTGEKGKKSKKGKKPKQLKLTFTPSMRAQILARYLAARRRAVRLRAGAAREPDERRPDSEHRPGQDGHQGLLRRHADQPG